MADEPKKRQWFQYHLSTLIVLNFVVGGLIWSNTTCRLIVVDAPEIGANARVVCDSYGWPMPTMFGLHYHMDDDVRASYLAYEQPYMNMRVQIIPTDFEYNFVIDLIVFLAVVGLTGTLCEIIARAKAR